MFQKSLFALFLFSFFLKLDAQQQVTDSISVDAINKAIGRTIDESDEPLPVITYTPTPQKFVIADITVSGLKNSMYEDYTIIGFSGLSVGDQIEIPGTEIPNTMKRFWRLGLFSDIKVEATKVKDGKIWLNIALVDRPRISDISFTGVKKGEREDLESRIGIVKGNQITPNMMDRAKTIIQKYFEGKGFNDVAINMTQTPDLANENQIILEIAINKNEKIKVNSIIIEGNEEVKDATLEKAMKKTRHKHTWAARIRNFLRSTNYVPEHYKDDLENLIAKYNELGYRDARIISDTVYRAPENDKKVNIEIKVDEGKQYFLRSINWVGNTEFSTDQLNMLLNMKDGEVYNQKKLMDNLVADDNSVGNTLYFNNGYIFYQADPVEVNITNDSVDLEIRIIEGPQATIRKVLISGNDRVYEDIVRRELRTKPGALFSREELMRSLREVAQMGHFDPEKLQPDIQPDPESGTVDIAYPLASKANDQIEFSAGWGQTGVIGRLSLKFTNFSLRNLFNPGSYKGVIPQGEGQTLQLSAQTSGKYYQSYSVSFMDPWFGGKRPNFLSVGLYYSRQTGVNSRYYGQSAYSMYNMYNSANSEYYYNNALDPDKLIQTIGASVSYGKRLNWPDDYFQFEAGLSYQLYKMKNWEYFLFPNGNSNNVSLSLTLSRNSIDNPIYTRRGSQFSLSVQATPPYSLFDGRDYEALAAADDGTDSGERFRWVEYHKWKFKSKIFMPLIPSIQKTPVLMTRAEYGLVGYYNKHKKSPFETFYMGGDGMSGYSSSYATETIGLRGYENGSLGYYASAYTRLAFELRYPLILEPSSTIYVLSFLEAGNAWYDIKDFNPFQLKRSAGVGARIMLPMIGLIGIDWAYGFDKVSGSRQYGGSQFHFVIGQEF